MNPELSFNFSETEEHKVGKIIVKLQVKNATGVDKISCKFLKLAKTALWSPLTCLMFVNIENTTVVPTKSDSDVMICLQSY